MLCIVSLANFTTFMHVYVSYALLGGSAIAFIYIYSRKQRDAREKLWDKMQEKWFKEQSESIDEDSK
jgi:hypothetical protein